MWAHLYQAYSGTLIRRNFWRLKEARNSFFGLGVYLLKSKFRIEDKFRFP